MKIKLLAIGKTSEDYLKEGMAIYLKRLKHYLPFEYQELPDVKNPKNLSSAQIKEQEGQSIIAQLQAGDFLMLLDEGGKQFSSEGFAQLIEKKNISGVRTLVFVIGGAYGFSPPVYERADGQMSLSKMTFSHQMVRLFALEQMYRAQSILKGEPYHHA